jgi:hypothetical protein
MWPARRWRIRWATDLTPPEASRFYDTRSPPRSGDQGKGPALRPCAQASEMRRRLDGGSCCGLRSGPTPSSGSGEWGDGRCSLPLRSRRDLEPSLRWRSSSRHPRQAAARTAARGRRWRSARGVLSQVASAGVQRLDEGHQIGAVLGKWHRREHRLLIRGDTLCAKTHPHDVDRSATGLRR